MYNKNGIQFLQLEKVFAFTEQESNYDLKPFEEIAEVIETKYGMLLDGSTYSVNQATLYYMENKVNDEQYEVIPVWIFNTEDKETGKTLQDIVNAETGKEIVWEELSEGRFLSLHCFVEVFSRDTGNRLYHVFCFFGRYRK